MDPVTLSNSPKSGVDEAHGNFDADTNVVEHLIRAIEDHQRPALDDLARRTDAAWRTELETYAASD